MPVTINGNTGVVTGIAVGGLPDGIVDTDMLAAGAVTAAKRGTGAILQVVSTTKTDATSTTSTTYVDISGMSLTLTPSSGSKCYITYHLILGMAAGWTAGVQILRDSTAIGNGDQYNANNFYASRGGALTDSGAYLHGGNLDYGFLDTHGADGSTAVTYKLQWISPYSQQPTIWLNRSQPGSGNYSYVPNNLASTLTVMDVAA